MTDFWDWAVAVYARDGVAEACLALQDDHGQCVPLLLWAAWRSSQDRGVDAADAARAVGIARAWSDEVVIPLRQVRRRLKSAMDDGDEAVRLPLREKIKAVELEAERALMSRLSDGVSQKPYMKQGIGEALAVVAGTWSADVSGNDLQDGLATLAEALTKA